MESVSDQGDTKGVSQRQDSVDDILVPRDRRWASVPQMGEETQSRVDRASKLIDRWVAMSCSDQNIRLGKILDASAIWVAFGSQRHQTDPSIGSIDKPFQRIQLQRLGVLLRMGPDVANLVAEKRTLEMDPDGFARAMWLLNARFAQP